MIILDDQVLDINEFRKVVKFIDFEKINRSSFQIDFYSYIELCLTCKGSQIHSVYNIVLDGNEEKFCKENMEKIPFYFIFDIIKFSGEFIEYFFNYSKHPTTLEKLISSQKIPESIVIDVVIEALSNNENKIPINGIAYTQYSQRTVIKLFNIINKKVDDFQKSCIAKKFLELQKSINDENFCLKLFKNFHSYKLNDKFAFEYCKNEFVQVFLLKQNINYKFKNLKPEAKNYLDLHSI
jgi:hypothetical protein